MKVKKGQATAMGKKPATKAVKTKDTKKDGWKPTLNGWSTRPSWSARPSQSVAVGSGLIISGQNALGAESPGEKCPWGRTPRCAISQRRHQPERQRQTEEGKKQCCILGFFFNPMLCFQNLPGPHDMYSMKHSCSVAALSAIVCSSTACSYFCCNVFFGEKFQCQNGSEFWNITSSGPLTWMAVKSSRLFLCSFKGTYSKHRWKISCPPGS